MYLLKFLQKRSINYSELASRFSRNRVVLSDGLLGKPVGHRVHAGQSLDPFFSKNSNILKSLVKDGTTVSLVTPAEEAKVTLISVPKEASRHNCASRPDALAKSLSNIEGTGETSITCYLKSKSEALATVNAVYRSFPFVNFKKDGNKDSQVSLKLEVESGENLTQTEKDHLQAVGESVRMAQGLTDLPPNILNPESMVEYVRGLTADLSKVEIQVIDDCLAAGLVGIHTVGKASKTEPKMIVLTLKSDISGTESVAIVGKGITYDTGGLSLKQTQHMKGMKRDMGGAAAALGAFLATAKSPNSSRATLHCILCLAENSVGPDSYRNDDVVTLYSGKSVEINNTDAEGRLLLADGVAYAHKNLGAEVIVDIATLTGAASIASGKQHASFVTTNEQLSNSLISAGRMSGDLVHELVFCPELHRANLKSSIADMKNSVADGTNAPSSCAATFVYDHLVASGFKSDKWIHIDMASVCESGERSTGYGVALLNEFLNSR